MKKNTFRLFSIVVLSGCLLGSCSDVKDISKNVAHNIEVLTESVFNVGYGGEIIPVSLNANCNWSALSWIDNGEVYTKVPATNGKHDFSLEIKDSEVDTMYCILRKYHSFLFHDPYLYKRLNI